MEVVAELARGRECFSRRAWAGAYESLVRADGLEPLDADDLELLARAAYMLGRDDAYVNGLQRAHHAHVEAGEGRRAVRCAFWIGHNLVFRGQMGPARGWFARARRLLDREGGGGAEHGYLLIPTLLDSLFGGDAARAEQVAAEIVTVGERFADPDLVALGGMEQGHALVRQGRADEGLQLVDETMVAVTMGELSPIVAGIVYCNTIAFCRSVFELGRARAWTAALTRWCDEQPEMVAHNGQCLVHRAELLALEGAWTTALQELGRLEERYTHGMLDQLALGEAAYQRAEVRRLRGEVDQAEAAYRDASERGRDPQPGLALLRLAQGEGDVAAAAIRRAVTGATRWSDRAALLPAYIEIMLAVNDVDAAGTACRQLAEIATRQDSELLSARFAYATGLVALAQDDPETALRELRRAWRAWQSWDAPYEAARARVTLALCCRALNDHDTATLHLAAASRTFTDLEAVPDRARVESLSRPGPPDGNHGLTERELEVLRLVAAGNTNRQVAAALFISEHTVARHLQNIFTKLNVSSRTAASAYAYEQGLTAGHQN